MATLVAPPPAPPRRPQPTPPRTLPPEFRFHSLVLTAPDSLVRTRGTTLSVSIVLHALVIAVIVLVPLLMHEALPEPGTAVRTFFVGPPDIAPPPPPPPPPAAGIRPARRAPEPPKATEPPRFVSPVEVPQAIPEEAPSLDLGVEGGVPGGVEGGVPGGVLGGVVGGLPTEVVAPPPKVVRVGGAIVAPRLLQRREPEYPVLAIQARQSAILILEAQVDTRGHVKSVKVLRGHPLFDEAAVEAVKQWRYQPLLLNGQPTEFILSVTVAFHLQGLKEKP